MGDLVLNKGNQFKLEIIAKLDAGKLRVEHACQLLAVSERTIYRYLKSYREKGAWFLKHGNNLKRPWNKLDDSFKRYVRSIIVEKYYDFNISHMREKLKEEYEIDIKQETLRKWCHELGLVKRKKKRRSHVRKLRERMSQPGLLVQMDGSYHKWFGGVESCLIAMIDDATSEVYAEFCDYETSVSCMRVLKDYILSRGVFKVLYTDRAGVYGGIKRSDFSQVERALNELGTHVVYAHSPEAKGRVERLFGTLQDRLIAELRLNNITTRDEANRFLKEQYLPHMHNPKFMVQAQNPESAYRMLPPNLDLESIFSVKEYRLIGNDHTVNLNAEKYIIANDLRFSIAGHRLEIRFEEGGKWQAYFAGKKIKLVKVKKLKKAMG